MYPPPANFLLTEAKIYALQSIWVANANALLPVADYIATTVVVYIPRIQANRVSRKNTHTHVRHYYAYITFV